MNFGKIKMDAETIKKLRQREKMINDIVNEVDNWQQCELISYVKNSTALYCDRLDDDELILEYRTIFGDDIPGKDR